MANDGPARRREIEDSTAARLAEIVAAAERAAKQVIDEAEEEARSRLADAQEEAERIVTARLSGLGDLTDEIGAQAEALVRQAEALQQALARAKAEMGGVETLGGSAPMGRREPPPAPQPGPEARKPFGPSLTVVGGIHEEPESPAEDDAPVAPAPGPSQSDRRLRDTAHLEGAPGPASYASPSPASPSRGSQDSPAEAAPGNGSPAGARLLATQMAVSGSSRAEIEARLRNGFKIADTRAILDAILGPEN